MSSGPGSPEGLGLWLRGISILVLGVSLSVSQGDLGVRLEARLWDLFQKVLPAPKGPIHSLVAEIDEVSIETSPQGSYPFPRGVYGELAGILARNQARGLVLDLLFLGSSDPKEDRALAAGIRKLPTFIPRDLTRGMRIVQGRPQIEWKTQEPEPLLGEAAAGIGFANLPIELSEHGTYRHLWLFREVAGERQPSLALAVARGLGVPLPPLPQEAVRVDLRRVRSGGRVPRISLSRLLAQDPEALALVRDKVVFVGATAARLGDIKHTALGELPGVFLHVGLFEELEAARLVREPGLWASVLLLLPWVACFGWVPLELWAILAVPLFGLGWLLQAVLIHKGLQLSFLSFHAAGLWTFLLSALKGSLQSKVVSEVQISQVLEDLEAAARGDRAGFQAELRSLPESVRDHPRILFLEATQLVDPRLEGVFTKAFARRALWEASPEEKFELLERITEEGWLDPALELGEELYRQDAGLPGLSELFFSLRKLRDQRWGWVSRRALAGLLARKVVSVQPLAEGGESLVFRARARTTKEPVVVKVLHPRFLEDPESLLGFRREVDLLKSFSHPRVPRLVDLDLGRVPFLLLEDRPGASPVPGQGSRELGRQLVDVLAKLHQAGVSHGDLHLGNLLWDPEKGLSLLDFSQAVPEGVERAAAGQPETMAPERRHSGPATRASDVYSLARLFEVLGLADEVPSPLLSASLALDPLERPSLSAWLEAVLGPETNRTPS